MRRRVVGVLMSGSKYALNAVLLAAVCGAAACGRSELYTRTPKSIDGGDDADFGDAGGGGGGWVPNEAGSVTDGGINGRDGGVGEEPRDGGREDVDAGAPPRGDCRLVYEQGPALNLPGGVSTYLGTYPSEPWILTLEYRSRPVSSNVSDLMVFFVNAIGPDREFFRFRTSPATSDTPGTGVTRRPLLQTRWLWDDPSESIVQSTYGADVFVPVRVERRGATVLARADRSATVEMTLVSSAEGGSFASVWLGGWTHLAENHIRAATLRVGAACQFQLMKR